MEGILPSPSRQQTKKKVSGQAGSVRTQSEPLFFLPDTPGAHQLCSLVMVALSPAGWKRLNHQQRSLKTLVSVDNDGIISAADYVCSRYLLVSYGANRDGVLVVCCHPQAIFRNGMPLLCRGMCLILHLLELYGFGPLAVIFWVKIHRTMVERLLSVVLR